MARVKLSNDPLGNMAVQALQVQMCVRGRAAAVSPAGADTARWQLYGYAAPSWAPADPSPLRLPPPPPAPPAAGWRPPRAWPR